ncbi:MAG: DegT/DnrJ/EryC1/StrS family aminotransferase [Bacteroidales bacterium]|jgi:dTDP-4-amino-4,6-dideoxygalactose transaminase|nr:DegT/DnrJ/EryC1/StrS family aminotransferase [Bacteroidales bacterium]
MKIPFSPPYIDDDVIREVTDSLRSGWITTGPKVKALEEEIADFICCPQAIAVNSWTSGAILSLKWFGLKAGDEVIVPAYTYCATAMAVMDCGATPVMVDINEDLTIDVEEVERAITNKTKAILPVDLAGQPCDYNKLRQIINKPEIQKLFNPENEIQKTLNRILLISDSAHSIGAKANGKNVAELVDIAVLSLHAVKNITSAEGGVICLNLPKQFNNESLKKWFKMMSLNGQTKDAFTKSQAGSWRYDIVEQGMKINMPDVNAAIALSQLQKYNYLLQERKRVYDRYRSFLQKYDWSILPYQNKDNTKQASYHLFPLRIKGISEKQRNEIINFMAEKEIATNVHYIPMPLLTLFKNKGYDINNYPKSFAVYKQEISLPLYPQLTNEEIDFVLENLVLAYESVINKL